MPPKKPKPQKVDLRELFAAPVAAAPAPKPAPVAPAPKPKPKPKIKKTVAPKPTQPTEPDEPEAPEQPEEPEDKPVFDPPDRTEEVSGTAKASKSKIDKAAKTAAKLAAAKAKQVEEQSAQLDKEVEDAREKAVQLRSTTGAYNGAMEIGPLTLPNPGGGKDLLEECNFVLAPGHRYGLIGRNGKGKSTLLRYLAARRVGGMPAAVSVHYVSQEVAFSAAAMEQRPVQAVLDADVERRLLLAEAAELEGKADATAIARLEAVTTHLEAIEADTADERADQLLVNLGFSEALRSRTMAELSGGWRVRVALAAALFAKPDVLLLDEPTNHLSIQAVMWLSHELANSPTWQSRIVVVVSHDRVFVDEACTDMLHISGVAKRLTASKGSYSTWQKRRQEQQKAREHQVEKQQDEQAKLKEYSGHGFKYGGSSGQINMMMKMKKQMEKNEVAMAEEAEQLADLQEDADLPITLLAGGMLDKPIVQLQKVAFGYPGSDCPLFKDAELRIDGSSRVVFVGENGNGKTTLVKVMLGLLKPTLGTATLNRGARIALVNQHHADQIDLTMSPLQFMLNKFPGDHSNAHELAMRGHLATCGVDTVQQQVAAAALSGGQRSRVAMAAVSFERPHLLVMDEPTNNLDLGSIEALAESVKQFEGGVVLVSHDQFFVSQVANEVWNVGGGTVKKLESFDAYRAKILKKISK